MCKHQDKETWKVSNKGTFCKIILPKKTQQWNYVPEKCKHI